MCGPAGVGQETGAVGEDWEAWVLTGLVLADWAA